MREAPEAEVPIMRAVVSFESVGFRFRGTTISSGGKSAECKSECLKLLSTTYTFTHSVTAECHNLEIMKIARASSSCNL